MKLMVGEQYRVSCHMRLNINWQPVTDDLELTDDGFSETDMELNPLTDLAEGDILELSHLYWVSGEHFDPDCDIGFKVVETKSGCYESPEFTSDELHRMLINKLLVKVE